MKNDLRNFPPQILVFFRFFPHFLSENSLFDAGAAEKLKRSGNNDFRTEGRTVTMKKRCVMLLFTLLFTLAVIFFAESHARCEEPPADVPKKLRVGFFEFGGYHMIDSEGVRSGYGYDILQLLRPYLHCQYEYVGYEKGWQEMLPMLEKGEIDFVTSAVKTPEKLAKFDYTDMSIGNSSVIMTVKEGQQKYLPKDYKNWNGMRVGLIPKNSKNEVFLKFAQDKGFSYESQFFRHTDELSEALQSGKVDAIVTGSLRKTSNEVVYEQLDIQPFYIIVKKGNKELLARLNAALEALVFETPGFAGELQQIYYGHWRNNMTSVPFTVAEQEFIQASNEAKREFVVLLQPGQFPLEYLKDGEPKGVFADIAHLISQTSGLNFKLTIAQDRTEYIQMRADRKCDLVMDVPHDFQWAENAGYFQTKPYYPVETSMLTQKNSLGEIKTVGTLKDSLLHRYAVKNKPQGVTICTYPSNESMIEAVKSGEIDGAYLLSPMAENAILNDRTGTLTQEPSGRVLDFAVGIRENSDARFISIISKCVNNLSQQEILKISRDNNLLLDRTLNFRELVVEYPLLFFLSGLGLIAILAACLAVVFAYHRRAVKAGTLLAKNSRMWNLMINFLPIHIFAKDVSQDFKYVFNNKARGDFFGFSPEEMNGMDDYDLLPPNLAKPRRKADQKLADVGTGADEVFLQAQGKDGQLHDLYSILVPFVDEDGTKFLLGCSVDQTELEEARRKSEENAEWFQKTLISIGDGVLTTDIQGRITLLNPIAEKMLGTTLAECQGRPHTDFFNIVSYQSGAPVTSPVQRCLDTGEIVSLANHTDLISHGGTRYHIADSAAPIRNRSGKIAGAILVFRDVTKEYNLRDKLQASTHQLRDALRQAQRANSAKGIFLSQMSHEIRTPLNAIIGYLNIAQESGHDSGKIKECLTKGLDASGHLLSIINDILDISSIESGRLRIANDDFDFKRLLTGIVSMFYNQAERKGIKFEMQLRDLTEEWLIGDSLRVNQILLNLLSNALKFTPAKGTVTLMVKQFPMVNNRIPLMLQVTDTGCGMNNEYKSRLFKPFEQQDASTARKFGGTGLGLSITKNLVTIMGGTIEVESEVDKGTTFTVHLPFERSAKTMAAAEADFSKLRALVVDDLEEDRAYIQMVLAKCGVKSDAVESGEAALLQLERRRESRHPYDLCLLDLKLSGMDGVETVRKIRELNGMSAQMPIILVTAYDVAAISTEAHAAGANKVMQKPLFQSTFFDFLMNSYYHLNEKKNTQEVREALKGLSIMLVEDNQMNMDISTQYLERAGMKITPAWNGQEAVELFTHSAPGTFQAILMDIQMPIMDGYQATEAIRASDHPEAKTIPIIAMTANAFNEDIVKAMSSGMNDHISKPVFYDRLFDSLSKLIQKKISE